MTNINRASKNGVNSSFSNKLRNTLISTVVCATLTACGGSGGVSQEVRSGFVEFPADTVSRVGFVSFDSSRQNNSVATPYFVTANANFIDFGQPMSRAFIDSQFSELGLDTCRVTVDSADDSRDVGIEEPVIFDESSNSRSVSAGNVLIVSTPSGSWPDLVLINDDDGQSSYTFGTDTSALGGFPEGSVLNVSGDEFPEFSNLPIPFVPPLTDVAVSNTGTVFNSVGGIITPESTITWALPDSSASQNIISVGVFENKSDIFTGIDALISISCFTTDSGEFSFPENVQQLLTRYLITADSISISRFGINSVTKDDAAVVVVNSFFQPLI